MQVVSSLRFDRNKKRFIMTALSTLEVNCRLRSMIQKCAIDGSISPYIISLELMSNPCYETENIYSLDIPVYLHKSHYKLYATYFHMIFLFKSYLGSQLPYRLIRYHRKCDRTRNLNYCLSLATHICYTRVFIISYHFYYTVACYCTRVSEKFLFIFVDNIFLLLLNRCAM